MSYAVYVYSDATGNQEKIRSDELNWTGTWSSAGSYYASNYDAAMYGDDRYIVVIDNVGVNPTARLRNPIRPNPFSLLAIFQAGDEPPFSPPTPTEDELWRLATTGTVVAHEAYALASIGTAVGTNALNAAAAANSLAYAALVTAWVGTETPASGIDLANQALTTAFVGTATADVALAVAGAGTNAAAVGVNLANQALQASWAGTAALGVANTGVVTAWSGTAAAAAGIDLANQALMTAWAGTADSALAYTALQTAWTGTQDALAANDLAYIALQTAWVGTATGGDGTVTLANPTADIGLSVVNGSGTSAMRSDAAPKLSQAIAPLWTAHHRFRGGLAVPASTSGPYTLTEPTTYLFTADRSSILIASDDTTAGNREIALNSGNGDGHLLTIMFSGTGSCEMRNNAIYAGCRVRLQDDWRAVDNSAMLLRFNGTDWVELCRTPFPSSGTVMAYEALQAAWTGTALAAAGSNLAYNAHVDAGTKLDLAGGTLTGNLVAPNVEVGVGTVPYSTATDGTIYYDFSGPAYQMTTVREGTVFVSAINMNAGREIAVLLKQSGVSQTVGYSSSFAWYGTVPPSSVYDKNVLIAMSCLGDNLTDVIAAATTAV